MLGVRCRRSLECCYNDALLDPVAVMELHYEGPPPPPPPPPLAPALIACGIRYGALGSARLGELHTPYGPKG